jgi:transcriptional regulator GlxA family with amidase domain
MADILIIPGGRGARHEQGNLAMIKFIQTQAEQAELVLSICTGALLLGAAGLLDGLEATTHHNALGELASIATGCRVLGDRRLVDNGKIVTSAGIASGIDAALYVVQRLLGPSTAQETADHMEYRWDPSITS